MCSKRGGKFPAGAAGPHRSKVARREIFRPNRNFGLPLNQDGVGDRAKLFLVEPSVVHLRRASLCLSRRWVRPEPCWSAMIAASSAAGVTATTIPSRWCEALYERGLPLWAGWDAACETAVLRWSSANRIPARVAGYIPMLFRLLGHELCNRCLRNYRDRSVR
jgi:hypothetical protein